MASFQNIRSYKNRQDGLFLRNTENLRIQGGVFADNRDAISMELAENIIVDGASIIGLTDRFDEIIESQKESLTHDDRMVGINLHVATEDTLAMGVTIRSTRFAGFYDDSAGNTSLFDINVERTRVWDEIFSFWTTMENIVVEDRSRTHIFDMRKTTAAQHSAVYLVDRDSSLKPPGTSTTPTTTTSSSVVIADVDDVKAFCDLKNQCHRSQQYGYWYCVDTCLRTVIFSIDPTFTGIDTINDIELEILDANNRAKSFSYQGRFPTSYLEDGSGRKDELANTDWEKYVTFGVALPQGSYVARFKRRDTGAVVWPTFVETTWSPQVCSTGANPNDIRLVMPTIPPFRCNELIRNGNMEGISTRTSPWLHSFGGGVTIVRGAGRNGSNAVADVDQSNVMSGIGQYIDTRCVTLGAVYEIRVWVRLERKNGSNIPCSAFPSSTICGPKVKIRTMTPRNSNQGGGPTVPLERDIHLLTRHVSSVNNDWNLYSVRITMDDTWVQASSIFVFVDRGRTGPRLYLDNFSMQRVD
jgi:hypothetical protein